MGGGKSDWVLLKYPYETKKIIFISFLLIQTFAFGQTGPVNVIDGVLTSDLAEPVTIRLINSTGHDIDTLIFYNTFFPRLENDSSTTFFKVPNCEKSDVVRGEIKGLEIDNGMWSGTCKRPPFDYEGKTLIVEILLTESKMREEHYRLETRIKEIIQ